MKRLITFLILIAALTAPLAANDNNTLSLSGRVKAAITNIDLTDAVVLWPDSTGTGVDSIKCNHGTRWRDGEYEAMSYFGCRVPKCDSLYVFDVICEGYMPQTVTYRVEKVGKRESWRTIPTIFLERAPHKLKEVTVTASKIKFYHKGDTVVFNADAFQLAEGSMLDGLISQLPGVELNDDGQIKVNGEFVESLLLNGKEFLDGNNQLMLENIAAYTVKDVEVYRGLSHKDKWMGNETAPKQLTMNVKLKKEYNMGWLINAQGGVGTEDRYSGRLFAQWFTQAHRLTLLGNINNLNDNRKPGKSDTWTPEMMPGGTRRYRMGAVDYSFENKDETVEVDASVTFEQTMTDDFTTSSVTNFLNGAQNTYDHSFRHGRTKDTRLNSKASTYLRNNKENLSGYLNLTANYRRKSSDSNDLSATFDSEQKDIDMEAIKNLYSEADPARLDAIINRSEIRTDGSMRQLDLRATPGMGFKIPGTNDYLQFETYIRYNNQKEERWKDYTVNYGADPIPAVRRRQYFDDSPNHILTSVNNLSYRMNLTSHLGLHFNYEYRFSEQDKDSYMYALERLEDMGSFGVLPSGYLDAFDPSNSYTSRLIENKHSFEPMMTYSKATKSTWFMVRLRPELSLKHQRLNYWRDGRSQLIRQTDFIVTVGRYSGWLSCEFGGVETDSKRKEYSHGIDYHIKIDPTTPDPFHRLDVINDSDPLNITLGNDNLATAYAFDHELFYGFTPPGRKHPLSDYVTLKYNHTTNALVRGYVYDTTTGVRTTRTYNVDGNYLSTFTNQLNLQFGRINQFTFTSESYVSFGRSADMVGIDMAEPTPSRVNNRVLSEKLKFVWQIGKQSLTVHTGASQRRSTSDRSDFAPINAVNLTSGFIGNFKLPGGFGISTDLNVYTRTGYGMSAIDKTMTVWNARLTYNPTFARRWVFMLDGFDLLHQLSNIDYAVTATGRTVSYTNALPRYIMLSVQYRLNIQPKKK